MTIYKGKYLIALIFSVAWQSVLAQPSTSQNYVISNTVKQAGVTNEPAVNALPIETQGKTQTIAYFDGLGRLLQNVVTQGSATQKDIVTGIEYDAFGREVKKYLPYADQTSATYGSYKDNWNANQAAFYNGGLPNVDVDNAPYSLAMPEASPLNRVLAQGSPGTVWQPNPTNPYDAASHASQIQYLVNKADDQVRLFNVDASGSITSTGYYPDGELDLKVSADEQQQTVKEFTDKSGHVVLKRVMIHNDSLQTYYLYDDLEMLRAVIQPEGTALLQAASWVFPTGFAGYWMFLYRYDQRGRMIMKEVPGADSVNMIYDQWDRVVLTQDGNLRTANAFLFTKYDQLNRPVVTGQITDARALSAVVADVAAATGRFETVNTSATEGYTLNNSFPSSGSYTLTVYTTTHYDSYDNLPSWAAGYSFVNENAVAAENIFLQGQVVATQARVLGTSNFMRTVNYYDDKYRLIQTSADNAAGGKDRMTKILSFDGKLLQDFQTHTSRFYTTPLVIEEDYTYDHLDRLLTVTHKTGNQETVTISQNAYNELGQLLNKKIHQSPAHPNPLQKLDYGYNIRGWLSSVNKPLNTSAGYEESDLFNMELHYTTTTIPNATAQYNGNIAEEVWKSGYDDYPRGFRYVYDQANRLDSSWYGLKGRSWNFNRKYDEYTNYDHNGNMLYLQRYHGNYIGINNLQYHYNGNQVRNINDLVTNPYPMGFHDRYNGIYDYLYDANGNLVFDYNKYIDLIQYNHLNLPTLIHFTGKGKIEYVYDAAGNKLQKTTTDSTVSPVRITNYYYAGNFVYRNDTLEFISHPEGRLRPVRIDTTQAILIANLKYIYDYYLKDHLGNVRAVLTTEEQRDFYAATMETAAAAKEDGLFSNVSGTATAKPAGFSADNSNQMVSKLNGDVSITGNKRVGPSIVLKVMEGDTISISAYGWYQGAVQPPATGVPDISTELLPLLTGGVLANGAGKGGTISSNTMNPLISAALSSFLTSHRPYVNTRPKAFLNWMAMDEEFYADTMPNHMGAVQMPLCNAGDSLKQMTGPVNLVIRRNGWIYIYLSNESAQDVFFDNLVVNHKRGPLLEQNDYYSYGMQIPGLSTKAYKYQYNPNRYQYNGIEHDTAFGLDEYEAHYRDLDPVIGRWTTIDPQIEDGDMSISPYASMSDNPVLKTDPLGNADEACCGGFGDAIMGGVRWINSNLNPLTPVVELISGKSVESNLTEDKSRLTSATETAMFLVPEVKIEGAAAKVVENIAVKDGEKVVAKATEESAAKIHGNSLKSTKPTTLYKLEDKKTGEYLKTGITSKTNPEKRYSKGFMADKKMNRLDQGTRSEMAKKEREIVEKTPGPLNKEPWAGKKKE